MKRLIIIFTILTALFYISGCGIYSFTGASIPAEAKTISIQHFPNNASMVEPTLSQSFTDVLRDKFVSQTNLILIQKGGDLMIDGSIVAYTVKPVAIQSDQTPALNRLTIIINVRFTNIYDEDKDFETSFTRYEDYPSNQDLAIVQQNLIDLINEMLVDDIFNKAVVNW